MRVPASCVPGIVWPGISSRFGAWMLAMQFQLERSQWWPAERIREFQFKQLLELLNHAIKSVPAYAECPPFDGTDTSAFASWPILRKADLVNCDTRFRASVWPKQHGREVSTSTTGSTGQPVRLHCTHGGAMITHAMILREMLWHTLDFSGKLASINPRLEERDFPNWGPMPAAFFPTGPAVTLDIGTDIDCQLKWLLREGPRYLRTRPSNLRALLLHNRQSRQEEPAALEAVFLQSEAMAPDLRSLAREVWNVPLIDIYSCAEFGAIALQCPEHEHYHVQSESVYVEVLRDDGSPCSPGEVGRVIVTSLHNFAMPLIRYELGDYAEVGEPCPCGRGLPVLKRIMGRVRNMACDPTGRRFWPSFYAPLWLEVAPIRQLRLGQHTPARIEIMYVLERVLERGEEEHLAGNLRKSLGYAFDFTFHRVGEISRKPNEKFEEFVSLIPNE